MAKCKFCCFVSQSPSELLDHTVRYHKSAPGFSLKCLTCGATYTSLNALRMHLKRHPSTSASNRPSADVSVPVHETGASADCQDIPLQVHDNPLSNAASSSSDLSISIDHVEEYPLYETMEQEDEDFDKFEDIIFDDDDDVEFVTVVDMCANSDEDSVTIGEGGSPLEPNESRPEDALQAEAAQLLMHIRENCNTTQRVINGVVAGVDNLIVNYNNYVQGKLLELAEDGSLTEENVKKVFSDLQGQSVFEGVQTAFKQRKYIKKKWKGAIKPQKVVLKKKKVVVHGLVKEVAEEFGYVSPFLEQLESLLQCEDVMHCVDNPRHYDDSVYRTVLDGYAYKTHPVVCKDPKTLAIVLYVDDIQPTDSLSSKQGQKLRTYYWMLCNIYPELRSSLRAINILSIVKADVAKKYKNRPFLEEFVQSIHRLSSDEGVTFSIKGNERKFHGLLLFCIGDTPASANLGGFKESSSFSKRPCRQCMVANEDLFKFFEEEKFVMRNKDQHIAALKAFEGIQTSAEERSMDEEEEEDEYNQRDLESDNPSRDFGVNYESIIMEIHGADVTKIFPQDAMHILGEGLLELAARLVLQHAVLNQGLSLNRVNNFLSQLDYGHMKRDKPSPISRQHLDSGLRQNSSQMFLLAPLIPFIVKDHCREELLRNFNLLLMIVSLVLAYKVTYDDVSLLRVMIRDFLQEFQVLFPDNMIPKMHFLTHLPSQILLYGPLIQQWAMRFEGFHASMKRLTRIIHNMKNLSYSLMTRMLFKRALEMESPSGTFLYQGHVAKLAVSQDALPSPFVEILTSAFPHVSSEKLEVVLKLNYYGADFAANSVILLDQEENELPKLGAVCCIFKHTDDFFLVFRRLSVTYHCTVNAYKVLPPAVEAECGAVNIKQIHPSPVYLVRQDDCDYAFIFNHSKPQYVHFQLFGRC